MKAIVLKVAGRVQRVGFRRFVLETAQELHIAGYVRNEAEGSVSIFLQGEKERLEEFQKKVRSPPPPAIVKEIREFGAHPKPKVRHFGIRFGSVQEELQEGFGAVQTEFQDYREEFRGFANATNENFKHLESKYGEISEKLTNIMSTLIEESKKTREMLEVIKSDSRQTREMLSESMKLLKEAIDKMPGRG